MKNSGDSSAMSPTGAGQRGLHRLMLKLPAMRGKLQGLAAGRSPPIDLFEAYEDACVTLHMLHRRPAETDYTLLREYETICLEIEAEIIECCLGYPSMQKG
ncbi:MULTISPECIES: hypothetical protein [unclassified Rhizobium]|uniref:hypothetical protein n=1 Tax=unclassified Rhizobium TaxID=2613769 RepID=UPI000715B72A|nr:MULTISPECIES: hypothetical protein [unclassified Rhizobium]KQS84470.1 hypothetical protein ASG50_29705 [Rhizobium sp. Leaf386]KQU07992.1 hypothetical protein ASG68_23295 [Rhizobium sp. Leaf453]